MLAFYLFMGPKRTLTYSATSTVVLVIGMSALIVLNWLQKKSIFPNANLLTIVLAAIIVYGTITPFVGKLKILDVTSLLGRSENLTERGEIWNKLIPLAMQDPILGKGFGYWTDQLSEYLKVQSGHNGYLDTIFTLGFLGLILMSVFLIDTFRKAHKEMMRDSDWGILWICLIFMGAIHSISESSLDSFTGIFPMIIFITLINHSHSRALSS